MEELPLLYLSSEWVWRSLCEDNLNEVSKESVHKSQEKVPAGVESALPPDVDADFA